MKKDVFKIFTKAKKQDDIIIPCDAVYSDSDFAEDVQIHIDTTESDRDFKKNFIDVLKGKIKKPEKVSEEDYYDDENELDSKAEAAFDYFRGITKKIDTLKKSVTDAVKSSEDKKNANAYILEVTERLDEINAMLDARVAELSESAGDIKTGYLQAQGKYDEISENLLSVSKTTEENSGRINELSDVVTNVSNRVNEIHTTTNSFDKLYDTVFEFKNQMYAMKQNVEALEKRQKKTGVALIVLSSVIVLFAAAGVALGILALVL